MTSLLLPDDDPAAPAPLLQLPDERPPSLQPDPRADALGQTYKDITDYMAQKQQESVDQGYWTGGGLLEGGHPTLKAFNSAADEYAQGLLMGTTSPSGKYLKAYHGSPHKFDAFSDHAIGTGEGAQAYGYGHYLAENENIARSYRDTLTPRRNSPEQVALTMDLEANTGLQMPVTSGIATAKSPRQEAADYAAVLERSPPHWPDYADRLAQAARLRAHLPNIPEAAVPAQGKGHMYEVNVAADPEKFLHWDKPLNQQHPDVQKFFRDQGFSDLRMQNPGSTAYGALSLDKNMKMTKAADVSAAMREAGIPGIRYLDAQSRQHPAQIAQSKQALADHQSQIAELQADIERNPNNMLPAFYSRRRAEIADHQKMIDQINERISEGTHNAVIFDPATMEIIRRYGLAGLMLGGGGLLSPDKQEQ